MKILIFTDNHFCQNSSLIRKFGTKYSQRIENQLQSLNWVEKTAVEQDCDLIICAGDFFDKPQLNDMELTAVQDIEWSLLAHVFLVGNHESSVNGLATSSTKALCGGRRSVISEPKIIELDDCELAFLPYIIESDRKPLTEYFPAMAGKKRYIISHNDIKGIQMGPVVSKTGFSLDELSANCTLCINGHLHNGQKVAKNVINLGNLTGQNFGEDAMVYKHNVMVLDTATGKYELIENPYAFNFYKIDVNSASDIGRLDSLKQNAVVTIKCKDTLVSDVKSKLAALPNVIENRILVTHDIADSGAEIDLSSFSVDHVAKFIECAKQHYGEGDPIMNAELAEVCK